MALLGRFFGTDPSMNADQVASALSVDKKGRLYGASPPAIPLVGSPFTVALAGFVNPRYVAVDNTDSTGFDITDAESMVIAVDSLGTATFSVEQTLDPAGLLGWFAVAGRQVNITTGAMVTSISAAAAGFVFPALGIRARIKVTALATADMIIRVAKSYLSLDQGGFGTTIAVTSATAIDAAFPNPVGVGLRAANANPTAMSTNADMVGPLATMIGALISKPYSIPETDWQIAAGASGIVNTTTAVTLKSAGAAGIRNYLTGLQISHDVLGAVVELVVRDGAAGTTIFRTKLQTPAVESMFVPFPTPLKGTAATLMEVALLTAVTGGVYVNAQGYQAP